MKPRYRANAQSMLSEMSIGTQNAKNSLGRPNGTQIDEPGSETGMARVAGSLLIHKTEKWRDS